MARIRTIKPEFWTSAQVLECSTNARLLFIGLWNFADDQGRHPDSPKQCKAEVFPADDFTLADVQGMLDELSTNGLIARYVNDGKGYFYIPGWHHQRIDKPQKPKYPDPFDEHSKNIPGTLPPDTKGKDTKGRDTKGEEAPLASERPTPTTIPADWQPNGVNRKWMADAGMTERQQADAVGEFVRWASNSGLRKANWQQTFSRNPAVKGAIGRAKSAKPSIAATFHDKQYTGTDDADLPAWAKGETA